MFAELVEKDPDHFAVLKYAKYKMAAGQVTKSILIFCKQKRNG